MGIPDLQFASAMASGAAQQLREQILQNVRGSFVTFGMSGASMTSPSFGNLAQSFVGGRSLDLNA